MKNGVRIFLFCIISFAFIGCDQVTKELAKTHLMNRQTVSLFHDTFRLQYVENTGAALGLGDDLSKTMSFWLLSMLPLAFLLILFGVTIKNAQKISSVKMLALSLIFAGGLGNIIDRILFDRHVTDFMNLGIQNVRTGIFNIADLCVTTGAIMLMVFFRDKKNKPAEINNTHV